MADVGSMFKKKIGPLPAGVWLLIIIAGVGVGIYIKKRAVPDEEEAGTEEIAGAEVTEGYGGLAQEPYYGDFPLSGGGPPSTIGGSIALTSEPIRIIVSQQAQRRCPRGKHWDKKKKRCVRNA